MIYTTAHIDGQVTSEELEKYIVEEERYYYNDGYANFKLGGLDIRIAVSEWNPLEGFESITFLSCLKQYTLGTTTLLDINGEEVDVIYECDNLCEVEAWLEKNGYFFRKVYGYEHSGLALSLAGSETAQFHCPFDSGVAGYMVARKSEMREERGVKRLTKKIFEEQIELYRKIVDELDDYINGRLLEVSIENGDFYEFFYANSLEEACDLILPFINQSVA